MTAIPKPPRKLKGNKPTAEQARLHMRLRDLGCIACRQLVSDPDDLPGSNLHHVLEAGYRNHDKAFGLCWSHHQGCFSIHKSKIAFENEFGTEQELMEKAFILIGHVGNSVPF